MWQRATDESWDSIDASGGRTKAAMKTKEGEVITLGISLILFLLIIYFYDLGMDIGSNGFITRRFQK